MICSFQLSSFEMHVFQPVERHNCSMCKVAETTVVQWSKSQVESCDQHTHLFILNLIL